MAGVNVQDFPENTTPVATDVMPIIDDPGGTPVDQKITLANLKTFKNTAPVFAAGSASANTWPKFTSGTLLTTPEDGAIELDADNFYGTVDAGNRGIIPIHHYIRAASDETLTSTTSAQQIFDSPANGQITLETGTYKFELLLLVTGMSATSGNAQILFAGTGTFTDWLWRTSAIDAAAVGTLLDDDVAWYQTNASAASVATAAVNTTLRVFAKGSFECSTGGTWIPQIDLVTAAAAIVESGSELTVWRIGAQATASVGDWS